MLDAICYFSEAAPKNKIEENEKVFSIFEFKALPDEEVNRLRYSLLCPVCRQQAYYRKASKDGKQACFGSRYHDINCEEFNPSIRKSEEQRQVLAVENLLVQVDALQIDFNAVISDKKAQKKDGPIAVTKNNPKVSDKPDITPPNNPHNKQDLKTLLVSLLRRSSLANSEVWIYTSEKHKWRAKNLFVNVNEAKPTDNGAPRMYWGTLSHADQKLNWLNPAEERSVGIPIEKYRQQFLTRFDIQEPRDLEGAGFIMFAKCVQSKDKKRKFLQLWDNDVQHFYISKAQD